MSKLKLLQALVLQSSNGSFETFNYSNIESLSALSLYGGIKPTTNTNCYNDFCTSTAVNNNCNNDGCSLDLTNTSCTNTSCGAV